MRFDLRRLEIIAAIELIILAILAIIYYGITKGILFVPAGFSYVQVDSLLILGVFMVFVTPLLSIYKWATRKSEREMEIFRLLSFLGASWGVTSWAIRDYLTGLMFPGFLIDILSFPAIFFGLSPGPESAGKILFRKMIFPTLIGGLIGTILAFSLVQIVRGYRRENIE